MTDTSTSRITGIYRSEYENRGAPPPRTYLRVSDGQYSWVLTAPAGTAARTESPIRGTSAATPASSPARMW